VSLKVKGQRELSRIRIPSQGAHYPTLDIRNQVFRLMKHFGVLQNARKAAIDLVQTAKKPGFSPRVG
jgi:hypothetical protein